MKSVSSGPRTVSAEVKSYEGKTVEFLCELSGKLLLLTGEFVLRRENSRDYLEVHHTGRLSPSHLPLSDYVFEPSAPHVRSLIPARGSPTRPDYFMEKPLRLRDCMLPPLDCNRPVRERSARAEVAIATARQVVSSFATNRIA
jgi:hypothetical protein